MTVAEDRVLILQLACLTGDRSKAEQRALRAEAKRLDADRNKITPSNPRAAKVKPCVGWYSPYKPPEGLPVWDLNSPEAQQVKSIDNPKRHPKGCACHRTNLIPADGLSQLEAYVVESWEPSE